jgi:ankyrin repeat protein
MYFDNYFFVWILFVAIWILFLMITSKHTNLHKATINGYYKQAKWLLEKGVNPDIIKNGGMTPLFYAIQHDEIKIVELLLDYGANINWGFGEENMFNPLLEAVINNRQEIVKLLIDRGVERGIHYFCVTGNISLVSNELTNIPELIYSKYNTNCSLLHLAIIAGNLELIDLLLERGADINDFSDRVGTGSIPLFI